MRFKQLLHDCETQMMRLEKLINGGMVVRSKWQCGFKQIMERISRVCLFFCFAQRHTKIIKPVLLHGLHGITIAIFSLVGVYGLVQGAKLCLPNMALSLNPILDDYNLEKIGQSFTYIISRYIISTFLYSFLVLLLNEYSPMFSGANESTWYQPTMVLKGLNLECIKP